VRPCQPWLIAAFTDPCVVGGGALFAMTDAMALHCLNTGNLPPAEVLSAVQIMAVCVALRWMGGLYRGVVSGSER
jgi:hypothetical protein